jgi:hypothetical protein
MTVRIAFVSAICLLMATSAARASSIVFDGGGPNQQDIFFADSDYSWTAATNNIISFTLPVSTITGADWWGGCVADAGGGRSAADTTGTSTTCSVPDFMITLYDGVGGTTPGSVIASLIVVPTATLTGLNINGTIPEYHYSATFAPLALTAGSYLFGLSADLPGTTTWGWETTPGGEAQHFQFNDHDVTEDPIDAWHQPPNALGFDLVGPDVPPAVPEPATLSLVAIGLASAALRRRQTRANR